MPAGVVSELQRRGHHVTSGNDSYMDFGSGQFIWRLGDAGVDGYVAASRPCVSYGLAARNAGAAARSLMRHNRRQDCR